MLQSAYKEGKDDTLGKTQVCEWLVSVFIAEMSIHKKDHSRC